MNTTDTRHQDKDSRLPLGMRDIHDAHACAQQDEDNRHGTDNQTGTAGQGITVLPVSGTVAIYASATLGGTSTERAA